MDVRGIIQSYWADFVSLLFPNRCCACETQLKKGEQTICLACSVDLPLTGFHLHKDNPVAKRFWGRVDITHATALYYFTKGGKVQHLVHQLKYKDRTDVGTLLGNKLGQELLKWPDHTDIDMVVPVPLHPKKKHLRGYNQSDFLAQGIADTMDIDFEPDLLERNTHTDSQTKKSREERWLNVKDVFGVKEVDKVVGRHILLVDDVMTTGATLEACASKLLELPNTKVSIATIAMAE